SREIHRVGSATVAAVANAQSPQALDHDRLSIGITQLVEEFACRTVNIDVAIPKIANQDIARESTEAGRRPCHAPWRVQLAVLRESLQSRAVEIKGVHNAVTLAGHVVFACIILYRIRHKQLAAGRNHVEWGITFFQ